MNIAGFSNLRALFTAAVGAQLLGGSRVGPSAQSTPKRTYVPGFTGTVNVGRNAEKRRARQSEAKKRLAAVAANGPAVRTRKVRQSLAMTDMLAERRLRQRA